MFPKALKRLRLSEAASRLHIAWDIGAGELARSLSLALGAPAILAGYSRLVVDCNRRLDDPTSIVEESDGLPIPGNKSLSDADRKTRAASCYEPYHAAIAARLAEFRQAQVVPALIAVHSFTPVLGHERRPWPVGILWDQDPRIPQPLITRLRGQGFQVGDNQPYSGRHPADYTVDRHAEAAGLPHVCIEVRQDLLESPGGVEYWTGVLGDALATILKDEKLYQLWDVRGRGQP